MSTEQVVIVGISIFVLVNIIGFGAIYISKKKPKQKK